MSENYLHSEDWDRESPDGFLPGLDQLESIVRSAGRYVQPTDDLRPKSLEAAHDACRRRQSSRRLGGLAVLVLLLATTGLPTLLVSAYPTLAVVPSAELHRRAALEVVDHGVEMNWALCDAFCELRREHSAMFRPPN